MNTQFRAATKEASRKADVSALASGTKSPQDLRRENASFAFPKAHVKLKGSRAPK